jgi:hypothetical protein
VFVPAGTYPAHLLIRGVEAAVNIVANPTPAVDELARFDVPRINTGSLL